MGKFGTFDINNKNTIPSASLGKRTLALLFDILIINFIIFYPFSSVFQNFLKNKSITEIIALSESALPTNVYIATFLVSVLALLYFSFFDYYLGLTPGKMIMRLKVVSIDPFSNEELPTLWRSITRNSFIIPAFPFYIFWIVEPIYIGFYKESFLDTITLTRTIDVNAKFKFKFKSKSYDEEYVLQKVK